MDSFPPEVPRAQPPNPDLEKILTHLQRMNADQVIEELNSVQPEAKQIKNQIDQEKEHLEMHKGELPNSIKRGNAQGRLNNITDVIKRTVVAINTRAVTGDIFTGVPDKSKNVLVSLCTELSSINEIGKINSKNSLFLNEIIIRGIEGRLETTADLISAFKNINSLEYLHSHLYSEIASLLQTEARKIGATEEQIKQLMTEEQKKEGKPGIISEEAKKERQKMIEKLDENSDNLRNSIKTAIDRLDISALERSDIAKRIRERTSDPQEQRTLLQDELKGIKTQLILKLEDLSRASGASVDARKGTLQEAARAMLRANTIDGQITGKDLAVNFNEFINLLESLRGQGVLESGIYESLIRETTTLKQNNELLLGFHETFIKESQGKGRLFYMASNYITTWSKQDIRLLQVLDDPNEFIEFAKNNKEYGYNGFKTPEDWKKFSHDLRNIFNTMFEGTASNPKDFWQSTFSELKEGMVYKELTTALFKLGDDLKKNPEFGEKNIGNFSIGVKDIYAKMEEQAYEGSSLIGGATLTTEKTVDVSLGRAIRSFTYEMLDYKELTQYAHDVNALTEAGLGFEKLNEFSSRLRMEDVMRLIRNMPGLSDAIKLYNTNIAMITARSGRAIPVDFGRRSLTVENLDPIGQETLHQLKNLNKIKKQIENKELNETDILRMVRFAAGLSKGVFSSFFGAVGNNHLAVETTQRQGDPDNSEDRRPFLETINTFKSTSDRGVEMMYASIDPDQNWLKFEKPRLWFEIRYASAPRSIRDFKPTNKDYWSNHADIYKWEKEGERAIVNGARNELIDHKKKHVFLKDHLKTTIVDLGQREGWRHYDYRSKLVYLKDEKGFVKDPVTQARKIDFHRTMMRLRGVGEEAVKIFINDLFRGKADFQLDASGLSIEDVGADIIEENRKYLEKFGSLGKKLNKDQKKAVHGLFYDKYIFQRIRNTQPSLFIAMETRSEIPEDEVRGTRKKDGTFDKGFTFHDQLLDYLVETYKDYNYEKTWIKTHLLPMYTSALQITEQNEWKKHYEEGWKNNEKTGHFDPTKDPFDYKFNETVFDDKENRKSLISFYTDRRASIGKTIEGQNKQWLQDENFIKNVKGFYRKMEEVIERDRWDHNTVQNKFGDWVHTGNEESLTHRYAKMLEEKRGGVDSYICWNLLNLDEFSFETSGNRMTQRAFAEAALYVSKGAPMIEQIFVERIGGFTRKTVKDDHEFEESVKHHFVEPFQQIHKVMSNIDEDISYDYNGRLIMFLVSAMQDDRLNRIGVLGPLTKGVQRRWGKMQSSYMTDKIPITNREGATSLDTSSRVEIFINTIGNDGLHMAREKEQVIGHEKAKFFGLIPGKPIYKKHGDASLSIEQLVNEAQVALPTRLKEQFLMPFPILLFIMALLAKLAWDKDKKK